jgi:uncharacterized membrane protein
VYWSRSCAEDETGADMELTALVDRALPGAGSRLDRNSKAVQDAVQSAVRQPGVRPVATVLRGNEWLGHPLHAVVVAWPIGAWIVSAWYDRRSATTQDPRDEHAADGALRVGVVGALVAAVTGVVQLVDARGEARREAVVHAGLNNFALLLFLVSLRLRRRGRRAGGRKVASAALSIVSLSGWLGGDLAFRHGVGVRRPSRLDPR